MVKCLSFQVGQSTLIWPDLHLREIAWVMAINEIVETRMWANAQRDGRGRPGTLCSTPQTLADANY